MTESDVHRWRKLMLIRAQQLLLSHRDVAVDPEMDRDLLRAETKEWLEDYGDKFEALGLDEA